MDKYYFTTEIAELLNPPPKSKFSAQQKEFLEDIYLSRKTAPLGCAPAPSIPHKNLEMGFGLLTAKNISAFDLIYPSKSKIYQSVYSENFIYKRPSDSEISTGISKKMDDLDNSSEQMKEILNHTRNKNSTIIVPSSCAKKINLNQRENISFDMQKDKDYVILKNESEGKVRKSKKAMMDQHLVEVLWKLLKMKNHENFPDLISSFNAYKNGSDKITLLDLQKMCHKFGISAPLQILEDLLEKCEIIDKDGALSFEEFIHSLHWKDLLPENSNFKTSKYANDWREGINNPSQDTIDSFRTTASVIGDHRYTVCSKGAGKPSYTTDIDRSKLKGVSEFCEFGDVPSMIQPNAFTKYGVFEEDLAKLHTKEKIKLLLMKSGIKFNCSSFETVWRNVSSNGKASISKVWDALKKMCLLRYEHL